jgi:FkbM family methyltransferase
MDASSMFEDLFSALPLLRDHHSPGSTVYAFLRRVARRECERTFSDERPRAQDFRPFGELIFPYHKMGAIDSLNLFDLDELILFSFYWANRGRYRHVLDIGANIGLHSIILSKCGYDVRAYEPDPQHFELLRRNLDLNACSKVEAYNVAVSSRAGTMQFVRVLGNTTGSHLAGSKANPYGELERFPVPVEAIESLVGWADLIKLDVEGHEKEALLAVHPEHWLHLDCLAEVGTESNARALYEHFTAIGVRLFSQKTNWQLVRDPEHMPASHRWGTLFVTSKDQVPWG